MEYIELAQVHPKCLPCLADSFTLLNHDCAYSAALFVTSCNWKHPEWIHKRLLTCNKGEYNVNKGILTWRSKFWILFGWGIYGLWDWGDYPPHATQGLTSPINNSTQMKPQSQTNQGNPHTSHTPSVVILYLERIHKIWCSWNFTDTRTDGK